MKTYPDKTLVVLPDDDVRVIIIPQSLQEYINSLESEINRLREELRPFIEAYNLQQSMGLQQLYQYMNRSK